MGNCVPTVSVVYATRVVDTPSDHKQVDQDHGPDLGELDLSQMMALCRKDPRVLLNEQLASNMTILLDQLQGKLYSSAELATPVFCQVVTQLLLRACPDSSHKISMRDYHTVWELADLCAKYASASMKDCVAQHQTQLLRGAEHYNSYVVTLLVNKVVSA